MAQEQLVIDSDDDIYTRYRFKPKILDIRKNQSSSGGRGSGGVIKGWKVKPRNKLARLR